MDAADGMTLLYFSSILMKPDSLESFRLPFYSSPSSFNGNVCCIVVLSACRQKRLHITLCTNLFETLFNKPSSVLEPGCPQTAMDTGIMWDFKNEIFLNTEHE